MCALSFPHWLLTQSGQATESVQRWAANGYVQDRPIHWRIGEGRKAARLSNRYERRVTRHLQLTPCDKSTPARIPLQPAMSPMPTGGGRERLNWNSREAVVIRFEERLEGLWGLHE